MAGTTLGTAYVQIVPSARGISGSISNVLSGEGASAGTAVGGKIGSFAKKAIIAAGIGTAVVGVVKGAISEGGKLQQSYFGGLDTLYGEAADSARAYAREAAAAGISMNNYSEQAVSFGAALKRAYGGDAKKAVEAANTAILDMADNSAKMGTDLSSIQFAYQGFAKQNYTMLDNLKLGYGGTKTEMQRLLADAEALTGKKYDLSNLGDVYEAIHVIQQDLGLTGVAAAEAEGTFTGSFNAMKAAAQNFLGSLAIGEDVTNSLTTLIGNATTFVFKNLIPMIGTVLKGLPPAILTALKIGAPMLLQGISQLISSLVNSLGATVRSLSSEQIATWATTTLPKILSTAGRLIKRFADGLIMNIPKIVVALAKIGLTIVKGLGSALWGKVTAAANGIKDRFMKPINSIVDKFRGVVNKIKGFFPISIGKILSNVKLPHFKISGKFSLNPPSIPNISVAWYKQGGIVNDRTVFGGIGMGEAGPEAIVPLTPFWKKLEQATATPGNITINVYASDKQNVKEIANEVKNVLIKEVNGRRLAWQ